MLLYFEVLEGDRQGARFQIKPGLSIGRRKADILLRDAKVSGRHAVIESRENNSLYLVDAGSANGIKVNGQRVPEVLLSPGTKVQLGRTFMHVIDLEVAAVDLNAPIIETWSEALERLSFLAKDKGPVEKREVAPFNPMVILKIVQGPQTGTEWELGYGPRAIGAKPLDLQLDEPGCPDICFELLPKRTGHIFRTAHPDQVKLNGRELSEEELASGDVIEINKTRIQILFSDESN